MKTMVLLLKEAIGVMQEIINGLDGKIPDHLIEKLEKIAEESERIRNAN